MVVLLLIQFAHGACDQAVRPSTFQAELRDAEEAFSNTDADRFHDAVGNARYLLPCVDFEFNAREAAGYHRVQALSAFFDGDERATIEDFRAVRRLQPSYELPQTLAPAGHPLHQLFDTAGGSTARLESLDEPEHGHLLVDGVRTRRAPTESPYVLQWVGSDGSVRLVAHVRAGERAPAYPIAASDDPPITKKKAGKSRKMLLAGIGTGVAAAGALVAADRARYGYIQGRPASLKTVNYATGLTGYGLAITATGLTLGALVSGDW